MRWRERQDEVGRKLKRENKKEKESARDAEIKREKERERGLIHSNEE